MTDWINAIHTGDAFDVLPELPSNSIHACVTDPPYGLAFMGRDWDDFEPKEYQAWCERWASKALRVLKPGGHMIAFSGNRTHHRLFAGVEDAGFEIRDTVTWHYGSGFPKALDVSKAIDKAEGVEREVTGTREYAGGHVQNSNELGRPIGTFEMTDGDARKETAPATDAAETWDGWKTGLKPATEFVVVARAPLSEGTVAENVRTHGTGALNIDGCRVGTDERYNSPAGSPSLPGDNRTDAGKGIFDGSGEETGKTVEGRYPANVVFDETAADELDGVTRYFYTSKATRAERTLDGTIDNAHPTVKPADLMEWLVRLVTAEGQTALDPFTGTGTTCRAAKDLGREFIGVERDPKWADVARVRCGLTPENPSTVRGDDAQRGLEAFATDGGDHDS